MKTRIIILAATLSLSLAASAHRLNEYLLATTIDLSLGKVELQLRLTPGVAVTDELLRSIDLNSDQLISATEQRSYVARLAHDLTLTLDGRSIALRPISFSFATIEAMKKGTGDIVVEFEGDVTMGPLSPGGSSKHLLELKNDHYRPIAVYIVNCLLPSDARIHVDHQTRNADQSLYQLAFTIGDIQPDQTAGERSMAKSDRMAVIRTYFVHGIRHILTGYDHLLFLFALVLGAAGLWDLIKIVTAFTIAHSITLTLATFGLVHLPPYIVEPIISISIIFIAIQNIVYPSQSGGGARMAAAFFFGLFHGLGFAGGLLELMHAMPPHLVIDAILGFSLGVEAGNQLVLLPLYGLLRQGKLFQKKPVAKWKLFTFQQFASGAIAIAGLYYLYIGITSNV